MDNSATPPIPPASPGPPTSGSGDARTWAMLCHLSALAGLLPIPFGNVLGPLIVWQLKKNEYPEVDEHGRESLNFQISAAIYTVVGGIASFFAVLSCAGVFFVPVFLGALGLIHLGALVFAVIGAIKANEGRAYRYPLNLRLVH